MFRLSLSQATFSLVNKLLRYWLLTAQALFFLRVVGQILVALLPQWAANVPLPPMEQWYSGAIPYPQLLISQILILMLMSVINWSVWSGQEVFLPKRKGVVWGLRIFAGLYAGSMLIRFGINVSSGQALHHIIPISLHLVLASYLWTLSVSKR